MTASNEPIPADEAQAQLARELQSLGYALGEAQAHPGDQVIAPVEAARAVLAVLRRRPDLAGPDHQPLLGPLQSQVFGEVLSADEVIRAVRLFRRAHEHLDQLRDPPRFAPHAAPLVAMLVSDELRLLSIEPDDDLDEIITSYSLLDRAVLRVRLLLALEGIDDREAPPVKLAIAFATARLAQRSATADEEGMRIAEQVLERLGQARAAAIRSTAAGKTDPDADPSDVDPLALWIADTVMELGAMPGPSEPD